jgi:hypothetical protein
MLLGWPDPEIAHMKKNEMATLSERKPTESVALGPGPVT